MIMATAAVDTPRHRPASQRCRDRLRIALPERSTAEQLPAAMPVVNIRTVCMSSLRFYTAFIPQAHIRPAWLSQSADRASSDSFRMRGRHARLPEPPSPHAGMTMPENASVA